MVTVMHATGSDVRLVGGDELVTFRTVVVGILEIETGKECNPGNRNGKPEVRGSVVIIFPV